MSGRAGTNRAGKSNKEIGNRFESEMSKILGESGFWCHVMQQNKAGQPADLIAVKGRYHVLIDCKEMSHNRFEFYRAEENQRLAMQRFYERGGHGGWFALKLPDGEIRMLSFARILFLEHDGRKSIGGTLLTDCTWTLEDWLNAANGRAFDENNDQQHDPGGGSERGGAGIRENAAAAKPGIREKAADGILDGAHAEGDPPV